MTNPLIRFVKSVCVQTAVYWGAPQPDGMGGESFADPVEIRCRWDDKPKLIRSADGEERVTRAEVLVTQDMDVGGMLYLGALESLTPEQRQAPKSVPDAYGILRVDKTPLFRSTNEFVWVVYL